MFDHVFPQEQGFGGMMPDIPIYQWGYASILALGIVLGIATARWQARRARHAPPVSGSESLAMMEAITDAQTPVALAFEHRPPVFIHHRSDAEGHPWITVRLEFRTDRTVKDASPYLLGLRRYENGIWSEDILAGMRVRLSWPGSGDRFAPRRIDSKELVLLLDYDVERRILSFVNDKKHAPFSIRKFMDNTPPGKYFLGVGVAGDDTGMIEAAFILDWFGDLESLSLQRAPMEMV